MLRYLWCFNKHNITLLYILFSTQYLKQIFEHFIKKIQLVLLNACFDMATTRSTVLNTI